MLWYPCSKNLTTSIEKQPLNEKYCMESVESIRDNIMLNFLMATKQLI